MQPLPNEDQEPIIAELADPNEPDASEELRYAQLKQQVTIANNQLETAERLYQGRQAIYRKVKTRTGWVEFAQLRLVRKAKRRELADKTVTRPGLTALVAVGVAGATMLVAMVNKTGFVLAVTMMLSAVSASGLLIGVLLGVQSDDQLRIALSNISDKLSQAIAQRRTAALDQASAGKERDRTASEYNSLCRKITALDNARKSRCQELLYCGWESLTGVAFENFLSDVFQENGYAVSLTQQTGDQGVDLIVYRHNRKVAIQAKGYPNTTVGNSAVQQAHTGRAFYDYDVAAVVTNSTFTKSAVELAAKIQCQLVDKETLPDLIKGQIGW